MIGKYLSIGYERVIILRSQCARGTEVHQNLMLRDQCFQSFLRSLVFSLASASELEQNDGLDHVPKARYDKAEFVVQKTFHCRGLCPACHHHIAEACEQSVGKMSAENPFGDQPARRAEYVMDLGALFRSESSHIQGTFAKADDHDALAGEYVQGCDIALADDLAFEVFLIYEVWQVLAIGILSGREQDIGKRLFMIAI